MNFKEWHAKQKFFPDEYHEELMRFAWQSAQEEMRERAALVCDDFSTDYESDRLVGKIRALQIEV